MNVDPPDREIEAIKSVVHALREQIEHDYPEPPVRRDAHPKAHGTVQAEFVVSRSIPDDLRQGVFSKPGAFFRAYVRFSNCFHIEPDLKGDPRGMGIKLLGVQGEQLDTAEGCTQDFLGATSDAFFIPDMVSYVGFPEAAGKPGLAVILFFIRNRLWRGLANLGRAAAVPAMNPLAIEYYSQTPYRLGHHRIVKYLVRPAITEALGRSLPWLPGFRLRASIASGVFYLTKIISTRLATALIRPLGHPDLLRRALAASLKESDAWFEFLVQVREAGMSTEDATERWPQERSPWQRVAWIRIPRQAVAKSMAPVLVGDDHPDSPAGQMEDVGENLSFNPWNGLTAHEPLGSINRGRQRVNGASARFRHTRNHRPIKPPRVDAFDALAAVTRLSPGSIDPKPEPDPFTFGSSWAYLYLRRVPLLTAVVMAAFALSSVLFHPVRMFTGGIFDVPDTASFAVAILSFLLAFTVMTTWWVITAYGDRRFGARHQYAVYPIRNRWYAVAILLVAGPVAASVFIGSGVHGWNRWRTVTLEWAAALLVSLFIAWSARWIAAYLGDLRPVKRLALALSRLPGRGAGYLEPRSRIFLAGHGFAIVLATLSITAYVAVGSYTIREASPRFPALVFLLFIPILGCWLLSALTFLLDRNRFPVLTAIAVVTIGLTVVDCHTFVLGDPVHHLSVTPGDVLQANRPGGSDGAAPLRSDTAIVVAASGGGTQAAAWTARVLTGLDAECGSSCAFSRSIALISGTSGGAVGGMFVARAYTKGALGGSYETLREKIARSTENALWRTLVYRDIFGWPRRMVTTRDDDRGLALERAWEDAMEAHPWLSTFQEDARSGVRPGLVFTTAVSDTGSPLLISTAGRVDARADFLATYSQRDIPIARAARLSASFPIVTPLPKDDSRISSQRLVDGGVTDLFGVDAAVQWLGSALKQPGHIDRVLLLQIEAPQETGFSLVFANRAADQRARNELAIRNLQLSFAEVKFEVVTIALEDQPSIAWHLTGAQRDTIDLRWSALKAGEAVRQIRRFLRPNAVTPAG